MINVPCSHVAHMEEPGSRTYRHKWTHEMHRNYRRVAEVWLDEYSKYLYWYLPETKVHCSSALHVDIQISHSCNKPKLPPG